MYKVLTIIDNISQSTGISSDLIKTAVSFLITLLLSPLFRIISSRILKNIFSIVLGSLLLVFMIQQSSIFIFGGILFPYVIMKMSTKPFIVSCMLSLCLLMYSHVYRLMFQNVQWKVDSSVYVMLLVAKLTYYGKYIQKNQSNYNFFDYLGYHLFFPSIIVGPIFSFQIYQTFLINQHNATFKNIKWIKALEPLGKSLIFLIILLNIIHRFPNSWVLTNQWYLNLNLSLKILSLYVIGFIYRVKYYFAWYFGQAMINLSGLSYSQNGQYDAVVAISFKFQTEANPKTRTPYWNASMQQWLKNVVFQNLSVFGSNTAFFGTFLISAFWHGLYPSYFYGFLLWGIFLHVSKWIYKWNLIIPNNINENIIFKILISLISSIVLDYIGLFMVLIKWDQGWAFHGQLNHIITIVLMALLVISFIIKPPKTNKNKTL